MATNDVKINDLIEFEIGDSELERLLPFLYKHGRLLMNCKQCGLSIVPQSRRYFAETGVHEFSVDCVSCGNSHKVRMYGSYGFILPTDDEFYKSEKLELFR